MPSLYTTTITPTSAQLEAEWAANWASSQPQGNGAYLFSEIDFSAALPATIKLYCRGRRGKWHLHEDGAITVTAVDPTDGAYGARHLINSHTSGYVWASSVAGVVDMSRVTV